MPIERTQAVSKGSLIRLNSTPTAETVQKWAYQGVGDRVEAGFGRIVPYLPADDTIILQPTRPEAPNLAVGEPDLFAEFQAQVREPRIEQVIDNQVNRVKQDGTARPAAMSRLRQIALDIETKLVAGENPATVQTWAQHQVADITSRPRTADQYNKAKIDGTPILKWFEAVMKGDYDKYLAIQEATGTNVDHLAADGALKWRARYVHRVFRKLHKVEPEGSR